MMSIVYLSLVTHLLPKNSDEVFCLVAGKTTAGRSNARPICHTKLCLGSLSTKNCTNRGIRVYAVSGRIYVSYSYM
eukprot:8067512-Pyramimonas_sp.AAC.1